MESQTKICTHHACYGERLIGGFGVKIYFRVKTKIEQQQQHKIKTSIEMKFDSELTLCGRCQMAINGCMAHFVLHIFAYSIPEGVVHQVPCAIWDFFCFVISLCIGSHV